MTDPLDRFPAFAAEVQARLEMGRRAYRDRSFERPPAELVHEIEQELLDTAAWAFILHERIRRLRERVDAAALPSQAVRVVPLLWQPEAHRFQAHYSVVLPRLPVARELIELEPTEHYEGGGYRVQLVRHTPGAQGGVDADLYLVAEPLYVAAKRLRTELASKPEAES